MSGVRCGKVGMCSLFLRVGILLFGVFFLLTAGSKVLAADRIQKTGNPIVIVIDPGHGGENNGTTESGFLEKEMNMTTARAMYDELSRFEGIQVYLTHWEDSDLSLKERAKYAEKVQADILISLHFNASETHLLYGSEAWISQFEPYHAYTYQLGTEFMKEFRDMGFLIRGIKTKPNSKGEDYYGIIRESVALGIPAIIVEHCHVDNHNENDRCRTTEDLEKFGVADAHAVAKYFGLKSSSLGLDYSEASRELADVSESVPVSRTIYDKTSPDLCLIEAGQTDYPNGSAEIVLKAKDSDSNLIYYAYSLDGGQTYCENRPWTEGDILTGEYPEQITLKIEIPENISYPRIRFKVFNPYDLFTESNVISFPNGFGSAYIQATQTEPDGTGEGFRDATADILPGNVLGNDPHQGDIVEKILIFGILIFGILFFLSMSAYLITKNRRRRK
ncbi:MAG: N-acetylmuramoyl-L-alanine amidase [Lachnospiraceae bacterium]|nr:N-acetylmuramoyl-L-alanine amidase [Lachnospiraceae bacterium]